MALNSQSQKIKFYKPKKRFIIPINNFHIPRKLFYQFKKKEFYFLINSNFSLVVDNCSKSRKKDKETWINKIIKDLFIDLHKEGFAKSIECYNKKKLIGGLYGLHIGSCFFGESMFSNTSNTSKFCLLLLITILIENNFTLLDSQFYNHHLTQFGAYEISDKEYQIKLKNGINKKCKFPTSLDFQKSFDILQFLSHKS